MLSAFTDSDNKGADKRPLDASLIGPVINYLIDESYTNAVDHGWWEEDESRTFGDLLALMHSELSEALEHYRDGRGVAELFYVEKVGIGMEQYQDQVSLEPGPGKKPDGVPAELADVLIRIFDMCGRYEIPLAEALVQKLEFNRSRPFKHGGRTM